MAPHQGSGPGGKPPTAPTSSAPTVVFGRRTDSGRFISYSRDDLDSEISSVDLQDYHVTIPMTPDNQPIDDDDISATARAEERYVSGSLFTGGFNSVTRAHVMDDGVARRGGGAAGGKGAGACMVEGCDARAMRNARGDVVLPCECDFRICLDCFTDAVKAGGATCPGCKEPYKNTEWEDLAGGGVTRALSLPRGPAGANGHHKMERRLSLVKQSNANQNGGEFDHNRWLFETKGTYGYGNAIWPQDGDDDADGGAPAGPGHPKELLAKPWRPLTRKLRIPAAVISPYRLLVLIRLVALAFFLMWRIKHQNQDAIWLWGMSIVCELWFAFSWVLDQLPKLCPINRATDLSVMLKPPSDMPMYGNINEKSPLDFAGVDTRLPMLVYVSREKRPGYDHNKKAGAMNALVRASAIMSNGPFILNLDCDHYVYNSKALREGMCFMMDRGGDRLCYVQFPQRFEGIDPSDRYANHNTVFFDVNMRALDGLQGPVYVGTGCLFRRIALYGFDPPRSKEHSPGFCSCCLPRRRKASANANPEETMALRMGDFDGDSMNLATFPKKFGNSSFLIDSIPVAEFQGRPLADHPSVKNGRPPGALTIPREMLDASIVAEAISVISCWYEEKTEWGVRVGWIYGSVTEDVVTGYRMHNRGWKSVYCVTQRDAFRGTAPINLTDRLHQVLRWATGSVEIFFSRNNALFASSKMKVLQRIAYLNVGIYPFTSVFLIVYCFLPALSLFSGQFIVQTLNVTFLTYLLIITITLCLLAMLEIKWSGIALEEWWRNEQFWLIGGTSAHLAAVLQGLLKVVAGIEISFTLTSKQVGDDVEDEFAELYIVKWTSLMIPPLTIIMINLVAIAVGFSRTIYSTIPQWSKLLGGVFFSFWVLAHLYPFAKGLMGRRGRTPTIVYVWSGLVSITISLLWIAIKPPSQAANSQFGGSFSFP
ncbi:hypothetical protein HU200_042020 [Digitaria exilis]|uniref:Uncharacterized protein n=1 Tax=Digitaria exilis TaxID=1010633 RepID=A0A835B5R6_9POAL|nr:hypothetical protein HU200_042020 [Digitaria exilis]